MESVSFYKFAAAIMQLLEPEKYSFNSPDAAASKTAVLAAAGTVDTAATGESETQTVAAVAEHLTNVIQQASAEEVVAAVQTLENSALLNTAVPAGSSVTMQEATELIKEAVTEAAVETIKEIKNQEVAESNISSVNKNFWDYYPELDYSQIRYADTVHYLYGYATRNSLFDYLNPEINLSERQSTWAIFTQDAGQEEVRESNNFHNMQRTLAQTAVETSASDENQRLEDGRKQADLRLRMIAEQRKIDERIAENRKA